MVDRARLAGIDQVQQHAAALDMAKEAITDAHTFGGAGDKAGNIGHHQFLALVGDNAQLRLQRREGIIANLGLGVGNGIDQAGLAGVRLPDQADIGQQLQPQPDPHFLARKTGLELARSAVGTGLVVVVALAAVAALHQDGALANAGHVDDQRAVFIIGQNLRAHRHLDQQIIAARPGAVAAHAVGTALGLEMLGVAEIDQRIEAIDTFENDVTALAAVAAIGAAIFHELLAPERHGPITPGTGGNENLGLIEKVHG